MIIFRIIEILQNDEVQIIVIWMHIFDFISKFLEFLFL